MMQAEIKIHIDVDNKKVYINGDVSLKAIMALLKGLEEDPDDYTIGQIVEVVNYPYVPPVGDSPWIEPFQPYINPNLPTWEPHQFGPFYCGISGKLDDDIKVHFSSNYFKED